MEKGKKRTEVRKFFSLPILLASASWASLASTPAAENTMGHFLHSLTLLSLSHPHRPLKGITDSLNELNTILHWYRTELHSFPFALDSCAVFTYLPLFLTARIFCLHILCKCSSCPYTQFNIVQMPSFPSDYFSHLTASCWPPTLLLRSLLFDVKDIFRHLIFFLEINPNSSWKKNA